MNKLERIKKEFKTLYARIEELHNIYPTSVYADVDFSEMDRVIQCMIFSKTPEDTGFWHMVNEENFDEARTLQPHLFEEERWRAEKGGEFWYFNIHNQSFMPNREEMYGFSDELYEVGNYFQTKELALASLKPVEEPKIIGVDMEQEGSDHSAECIVYAENQTATSVHIVSANDQEMINRDKVLETPLWPYPPESEPPHPHADSYTAAFGQDYSNAHPNSIKWVRL